jgi:hypothetical protein
MLGFECRRLAIETQTQPAGVDDGDRALIEGSREGVIFLWILRSCSKTHPRAALREGIVGSGGCREGQVRLWASNINPGW